MAVSPRDPVIRFDVGDELVSCCCKWFAAASGSRQHGRTDHDGREGNGTAMHIPDGYLSPQSCGVMTATMVPAWTIAGRRVRRVVKNRHVPLLAIGAAYCFLVMMFNV